MRIFEKDNKHNFVDENNVYVGYDSYQSCCENADWFIASYILEEVPDCFFEGNGTFDKNSSYFEEMCKKHESIRNEMVADWRQVYKSTDLDGYVFDIDFFKELSYPNLDGGGAVAFRLINQDKEKFLHLFNSHNGYYGHGFSMNVSNKEIREGNL